MIQQPLRIVTTSWDDGDVRDLRIAELLGSQGMRGTFYTPIEAFNGNPSLSKDHLRSLTKAGFEIGGHTIAHEILSQVPPEKTDYIVSTCKAALEDTTGQRV